MATPSLPEVDFRALFEAAPSACLVLTPDLRIAGVTDSYLQATLTRRETIVGRELFQVFPDNPDDPKANGTRNLRASLDRVLSTKKPDSMAIQKYDIRRPDGSFEERHWRPVNSPVLGRDGQTAWILHQVEDVTSIVKREEVLRTSEERFRFLVESVKDYAIFMLDPEGRVVSWNKGAEHLLGYSADEILGKHFSRFYSPDDVRLGKPDAELRAARTEGRADDEGHRTRKDGTRFLANVVVTAIRDADGTLRGFAKVTRDVTERQVAEQRIRELSTPVLRVRDHLLVAPVVGHFDAERAEQLTGTVLRAIRTHRARVVVFDVTGVATIDSAVANHLIQTVLAAKLLGAVSVISGVSTEIAETLVRIGINLSDVRTVGDLEQGLHEAHRILDGAK